MLAAQAAAQAAGQIAQQQAVNQLAGFNGQIKSKDDVSVQYQLVANGQNAPMLQNTLQGTAKSDGEDVLTPLLQQAATAGAHPGQQEINARTIQEVMTQPYSGRPLPYQETLAPGFRKSCAEEIKNLLNSGGHYIREKLF